VDKRSLKTEEHDLDTNNSSQIVASGVCGFLGILQIYGLDHFVVATESSKECDLPTYKQPGTNATTANVYALKQVQLFPFFSKELKKKKSKLVDQEEENKGASDETK